MTSGPTSFTAAGTAPAAGSTRPAPRLKLKPRAPTLGFVDGGWWPHSRDLATELPALLAVLAQRLGPVERVSYHLADWDPAARVVKVDGRTVRLGGFRSQRAHTIDVLGATLRLTLLVVAPEAPPRRAHQSLLTAGHRGDTSTIADLLAAREDRSDLIAERRWESEGGHVHNAG